MIPNVNLQLIQVMKTLNNMQTCIVCQSTLLESDHGCPKQLVRAQAALKCLPDEFRKDWIGYILQKQLVNNKQHLQTTLSD